MVYLTVVLKKSTGEYLCEEFKSMDHLEDYLRSVQETSDAILVFQTEQYFLQ